MATLTNTIAFWAMPAIFMAALLYLAWRARNNAHEEITLARELERERALAMTETSLETTTNLSIENAVLSPVLRAALRSRAEEAIESAPALVTGIVREWLEAASPGPESRVHATAAFLASAGAEAAAKIVEGLPGDQIEKVIEEIQRLDDSDEPPLTGGIALGAEILKIAVGEEKAVETLNRLTESLAVRPFDFIRNTDPAVLTCLVQGEHPQTTALILAYLDPRQSAKILAYLPDTIQSDVVRRVAVMDRVSPDVIARVERVVERRLAAASMEELMIAGGIDAAVDILKNADGHTSAETLKRLSEKDPELAEEIKRRMFLFEDIALLSDSDIQRIIRECDPKELALALKAVDESAKRKIFANMSRNAAQMLVEGMEYLGPVRLRDVEDAQTRIVHIAWKLEAQGEIIVGQSSPEEIVL